MCHTFGWYNRYNSVNWLFTLGNKLSGRGFNSPDCNGPSSSQFMVENKGFNPIDKLLGTAEKQILQLIQPQRKEVVYEVFEMALQDCTGSFQRTFATSSICKLHDSHMLSSIELRIYWQLMFSYKFQVCIRGTFQATSTRLQSMTKVSVTVVSQ